MLLGTIFYKRIRQNNDSVTYLMKIDQCGKIQANNKLDLRFEY